VGYVLVVHVSRHGSTTEVALRIAQRLRADGHDVDAVAARAAKNPVGGYGLVVVGGALYNGRWHTDAHRFLKRHRGELADVPVAVFGMGRGATTPRRGSGHAPNSTQR
jgi:menaquinone-dependent protoporphyrinogen oxidase